MEKVFMDKILERLRAKKIVGTDTMVEALYAVGNKDRWALFEYIQDNMIVTQKAFSKGLAMAYTMGRANDYDTTLMYFHQAQLKYLCTNKELSYLNSLKDEVTIYRGCHKYEMQSNNYGMSWSIDRGVAEFFAFRGRHFASSDGIVLSTKVDKSRLLALFLDRGEFETIVEIGETDKVEIVTDTPTNFYDDFMKQHKQEFILNLKGYGI